MSKQYWMCIIGPINKDKVPIGGDFPMRIAVEKAFLELTGERCEHDWSCWGVTEKGKDNILAAEDTV